MSLFDAVKHEPITLSFFPRVIGNIAKFRRRLTINPSAQNWIWKEEVYESYIMKVRLTKGFFKMSPFLIDIE